MLDRDAVVLTLKHCRASSALSEGNVAHAFLNALCWDTKTDLQDMTVCVDMLQVSGYVKAVSSAGVFVVLARNAEARVKMGHLSDSYVKDPKEAFPEGMFVQGRVISASDGRYSP